MMVVGPANAAAARLSAPPHAAWLDELEARIESAYHLVTPCPCPPPLTSVPTAALSSVLRAVPIR